MEIISDLLQMLLVLVVALCGLVAVCAMAAGVVLFLVWYAWWYCSRFIIPPAWGGLLFCWAVATWLRTRRWEWDRLAHEYLIPLMPADIRPRTC